MSTDIHTFRCIENAETIFREQCAQLLTAPAWDAEAMRVEADYVREWAAEWLSDGTVACVCGGLNA